MMLLILIHTFPRIFQKVCMDLGMVEVKTIIRVVAD